MFYFLCLPNDLPFLFFNSWPILVWSKSSNYSSPEVFTLLPTVMWFLHNTEQLKKLFQVSTWGRKPQGPGQSYGLIFSLFLETLINQIANTEEEDREFLPPFYFFNVLSQWNSHTTFSIQGEKTPQFGAALCGQLSSSCQHCKGLLCPSHTITESLRMPIPGMYEDGCSLQCNYVFFKHSI